jgi:hypothetical protein
VAGTVFWPLGAVRALAARKGLREIQYNEMSRVVAFAKDFGDGGTVGPGTQCSPRRPML